MSKLLLLNESSRKKILEYLPTSKDLENYAVFFQNFSDQTRLRILSCLAMCDMCVNDMSVVMGINQTTISHQLRLLKDQNLVSCKRDGKLLLYSLSNECLNELMLIALKSVS